MIPGLVTSSSWIVETGQVWRVGDRRPTEYHCSLCGEKGHSARTCGREPKR